jgi:hypothetical protein
MLDLSCPCCRVKGSYPNVNPGECVTCRFCHREFDAPQASVSPIPHQDTATSRKPYLPPLPRFAKRDIGTSVRRFFWGGFLALIIAWTVLRVVLAVTGVAKSMDDVQATLWLVQGFIIVFTVDRFTRE